MSSGSETPRPRLCVLEKGSNGYGFHLHGEKGKTGQFIRLVEPDSPAEASGLLAGDRLVFVNGECVDSDSHQQVVSRIRATVGKLELIVVDQDTDDVLQKHNIKCLKEHVTEGITLPAPAESASVGDAGEQDSPRALTPSLEENGVQLLESKLSINSDQVSCYAPPPLQQEETQELRPRLCLIKKGPGGYGFNLHSDRSKPGQYIRAVDENSPAQKSGLRPKDRIVQVNGEPVEGKQHGDVVAVIKAGGEETALLVVDPETDAFFRTCQVAPTEHHLTGPLPEPVSNGEAEDKVNGVVNKEVVSKETDVSVSPALSNASSDASLTAPPTTPPRTETPPPQVVEVAHAGGDLRLNMSLQQARERAHKKRSNKRAPPMDWSKKNELFSNL